MIVVQGIDPGQTGALVELVDGKRACRAIYWRPRKGGDYLVDTIDQDGVSKKQPVRCLHSAAYHARSMSREEAAKFSGRCKSVIPLAEARGEVSGPLKASAIYIVEPLASAWRPAVLNLPANASSEVSIATIRALMRGRRPMFTGLGHLADVPHVLEACCIARYAYDLERQRLRERKAEDHIRAWDI